MIRKTVTCDCGREIRLGDNDNLGVVKCGHCARSIEITPQNTREAGVWQPIASGSPRSTGAHPSTTLLSENEYAAVSEFAKRGGWGTARETTYTVDRGTDETLTPCSECGRTVDADEDRQTSGKGALCPTCAHRSAEVQSK
jgi:DNA-directed RNA polymerase subunit RPC12/RpoP